LSTQQILSGTAAPVSSTIDASFIYGITPTWAILGSINYSIQNSGVVNIFGGIQYSTCCWAIRVMEYGYVSNNNPNTPNVIIGPISKTFMVQLLLKGLGGTSGQGTGLLATIPGYNNQLGF
jgi:LPS-assembly protein